VSRFAIGAILSQNGHITIIISRSLTKGKSNSTGGELRGVVYALYYVTQADNQQSQPQQAAFGNNPAQPCLSAAQPWISLIGPLGSHSVAQAQLNLIKRGEVQPLNGAS
jgi:hypothetical protein